MKRLLFAVFAVLLFTTNPWAQTAVQPEGSLVRVRSRTNRHHAHAHQRHQARHHSHRRHSA